MQSKPGWKLLWGVFVFLLFVAFLPQLRLNILGIMINRTLSQDRMDAEVRQKSFGWTTALLQQSNLIDYDSMESLAMIPAMIQGVSSYRDGDVETAVSYFNHAASTTPYPPTQSNLIISPFLQINDDNSLSVNGNSPLWRVRSDSNPSTLLQPMNESVIFSCAEEGEPQKAVIENISPLNLPYHHRAILDATTDIDTNLVMFTVSNNQQVRQFVHAGTGMREQLEFTFEGDQLDFIYISMIKKEENEDTDCRSKIHLLTFLLDEDVK